MREIKFRAWHKELKKMSDPWKLFEGFDGKCMYHAFFDDEQVISYPEDVILTQFTGLKDKNGKEIYEGDIVKVLDTYDYQSSPSSTYKRETVYWSKDRLGWFLSLENYPDRELFREKDIEVIGNIYENPELLKNRKE